MHNKLFVSGLMILAITMIAGPASITQAAGDAKAGKNVFRKCAICHDVKPGKNKIGPSLHGVVGHKSAQASGYRFSPAMKKAGLTWDAATLDKYLENPRKMVQGTRMAFAGLRSKKDRDNVIAYLKTLK
ncbi:MAG: cytochrome c [Alphaproteobacteria bacterium]|jgi:cytochrome c